MAKQNKENIFLKVWQSIQLVAGALLAIALIYTSLNLASLKDKNEALDKDQILLGQRIDKMETAMGEAAKHIADLEGKTEDQNNQLADYKNQLAGYQKQLTYYKSLASAPKEILGASISTETPATVAVSPTIITKTVKKYIEVPAPKQATVTVQGLGSYKVNIASGDTAFSILQKAAAQNGFGLDYDTYSFGVMITSIGGIKPVGNQFWAFYYNGQFANVGASDQKISADDATFWRLESY